VYAHWIVTMPGMIAVIDGVIAALIVGLVVHIYVGMAMTPAIVAGAIVGVVVPVVLALRSTSSFRWFLGAYRPTFPSDARTMYGLERLDPHRGGEDGGRESGA
jgi:hypothetical protein